MRAMGEIPQTIIQFLECESAVKYLHHRGGVFVFKAHLMQFYSE